MKTIAIDHYVLDVLMPDLTGHDRRPSALLVWLAIFAAGEGRSIPLSYADLALRSGLSKRAVQTAVTHLSRRGLLQVDRVGVTDTPRYTPLKPWVREGR